MPSPVKAGEIFQQARFFLNDQIGAVFNDEVLAPALKSAYQELRMECEDNNIPYTNLTSSAITVPQGSTDIGGDTGPALPIDLIEIIEMYERVSGSGSDYKLMWRRNFLPKTDVQTTYLGVFTWQKQVVNFIGATGDVEVKIDYVGESLSRLIDKNSEIAIYNSCAFLWYRTAALAAEFIGENVTRAQSLNADALRCLETMENIGIKSQQSMPVRRQPFMSSYRQRGWQGNTR